MSAEQLKSVLEINIIFIIIKMIISDNSLQSDEEHTFRPWRFLTTVSKLIQL